MNVGDEWAARQPAYKYKILLRRHGILDGAVITTASTGLPIRLHDVVRSKSRQDILSRGPES